MATSLKEGVEIVNNALTSLGYEYQIDTTDNSTMTEGLEAIGAYAPSQRNAIMEQMNLILQQRNYGVMFDASKNKFRTFLVGMEENGFGIEDVFHCLIDGRVPLWDNNNTAQEIAEDLVSYDTNKIVKVFHTEPASRQFKTTIDRRNYEKVFTAYGVTRYIDTQLANLSWSAEVWLQSQIIEIAVKMVADSKIKFSEGNNINSEQGIRNMVEELKTTVSGFLTPTSLYNLGAFNASTNAYESVINMSDSEDDIFIITTPSYMQRLKVQGYANAYNLSQFELDGRIIYAPEGYDLGTHNDKKVAFIAIDRRALVFGIRRWDASSFFIPNTHNVNHWLTVEGIKGYNTLFNAVAFTIDSIDEVTKSGGTPITLFQEYSISIDRIKMYADGSEVSMNFVGMSEDDNRTVLTNSAYIPVGSEISFDYTEKEDVTSLLIYLDGNFLAKIDRPSSQSFNFIPRESLRIVVI